MWKIAAGKSNYTQRHTYAASENNPAENLTIFSRKIHADAYAANSRIAPWKIPHKRTENSLNPRGIFFDLVVDN